MKATDLCRYPDYAKSIMAYGATMGHEIYRADIRISDSGIPYARVHNRLYIVAVRLGMWDYTARHQTTKPA